MKFPLVVLACPTSDHKKYCQDEWINWIKGFTYPNLKILIVENSATPDNANLLKNIDGIDCVYVGDKVNDFNIRKKIAYSTQVIKDMVLNKYKAHAWLSLESDIFIPQNSIEYLMFLNKRVVCIPYFHFDDVHLLHMELHIIGGVTFVDYVPLMKSFALCEGNLKKVYQNGIGCMLIKSKILKNLPIHYEDTGFKAFPDYFIHLYFFRKKIPVLLDTSIYAIHKNNSVNWRQIESDFDV